MNGGNSLARCSFDGSPWSSMETGQRGAVARRRKFLTPSNRSALRKGARNVPTHKRPSLAVSFVLLLLGWMQPLSAAEPGEGLQIAQVRVGFDGYFKLGCWTPARIELSGLTGQPVRVEVGAAGPNASRVWYRSEPLSPADGGGATTDILVRCGRSDQPLLVRVVSADAPMNITRGDLLAEQRIRLSPPPAQTQSNETPAATVGEAYPLRLDIELRVAIGQLPQRTAEAPNTRRTASGVTVNLSKGSLLPSTPDGLDGVDLLAILENPQLQPEQNAAIREWVASGGRFLWSADPAAATPGEEPNTRSLASWVPVEMAGVSELRELSGLEAFAESKSPIIFTGRVKGVRLVRGADTIVLADGLEGPLVVRAVYGLGVVDVLSVDLDTPPLSEWNDVADLVEKLAIDDRVAIKNESSRQTASKLAHSGINELATQLNALQEFFPQVQRSSIWDVMSLIAIVVLLVGPLDYLFVRRVLRRPHLTWVTFPAMLIAVSVVAVGIAHGRNSSEALVNELNVIDLDVATSRLHGHSWETLYSGQTARYQLSVVPRLAPFETSEAATDGGAKLPSQLGWFGVPEVSFGGMYRDGGFTLNRPEYHLSADDQTIEDFPVPQWSAQTVVSHWSQRLDVPLAESRLVSSGTGQLSGSFQHQLPGTLTDWFLAYDNRVYRPVASERRPELGALPPGQSWDPIGPNVYQRELRGYLTGSVATRLDHKDDLQSKIVIEQTKYNPLSRESENLLRMISFHDAAGGSVYTGLSNSALSQLDLSPLLELNRAVVFGRIELPVTTLTINGAEQTPVRRETFVRIILPVQRSTTIERTLPNFKDDE
mgnify:FL=1